MVGPQVHGVMERGESVWHENLHLPIERGGGVLEDAWWTYSYSPVRDDDGSVGGTLVVCTVRYPSTEARDRAVGTGMNDGWGTSYARLDEYVRTLAR